LCRPSPPQPCNPTYTITRPRPRPPPNFGRFPLAPPGTPFVIRSAVDGRSQIARDGVTLCTETLVPLTRLAEPVPSKGEAYASSRRCPGGGACHVRLCHRGANPSLSHRSTRRP